MDAGDTGIDGVTLLDPVYAAALEGVPALALSTDRLAQVRADLASYDDAYSPSGVVAHTQHTVATPDGANLGLRVYRTAGTDACVPCVYAVHGGGYVLGSASMLDPVFDGWCPRLGVVGVSVEYRRAPEHPYPTPLEDCYAGLDWVYDHADELGIDATQIGIQGTSAGGGLAAALALLARDRGVVPLAFQVLECPMLDDRLETPSSNLDRLQLWDRACNEFGWTAYLGELHGRDDVPEYAAAARARDLIGLPPAIVCVGGADGFRDEDVSYAMRLCQAGVPTELHVYPGAPHGAHFLTSAPAAQQWVRDVETWLARQVRHDAERHDRDDHS